MDISNYSGAITLAQARQLKNLGVGRVVVQAVEPPSPYPPGQTRQQISVLQQAGIDVEAYVFLWFSLGAADISNKLKLLDGTSVRRVWLDVEDTSTKGTTLPSRVMEIGNCLDEIATAGYEAAGIYTGAWFWRGYMANTDTFKGVSLWDSNYDGIADPRINFKPYGGWTSCLVKQYAGTSTVGTVPNVDLDAWLS